MNNTTQIPGGRKERYLDVDRLTKSYVTGGDRIVILDELELSAAEGSIVIITGESGSGKTTLLNILGGLDGAEGGSVRVSGTEVTAIREQQLHEYRRTCLGFIFQLHHLLKDFSALENTALPAMICGDSAALAKEKAAELLKQVGLEERMNSFPYQLSGGERQRVAITRALINEPDLILADEPTGSLDEKKSREIESLLFDLVKRRGKTMVIVTHDQKLADKGDLHLHLSAGRLHEGID